MPEGMFGGGPPPENMNPFIQLLSGMLGIPRGDAAYSEEEFGRIIQRLWAEAAGQGGARPASTEAIQNLPKVPVTKEMMGDEREGHAECSICMDPVDVGIEVAVLPCKHWFHDECVCTWLKEHDSCPQCRKPISSSDQAANNARTGGNDAYTNGIPEPRTWRRWSYGRFGSGAQRRQNTNTSTPSNPEADPPISIPGAFETGSGTTSRPNSRASGRSTHQRPREGGLDGILGAAEGMARTAGRWFSQVFGNGETR